VTRLLVGVNLFWRTFFLLAILLAGGVFAWVQTLRALEFEPRAVQAAQQTAALVNLSRAALQQADGINRVALVKSLGTQGPIRVTPREPGDRWEAFEADRFTRRVSEELRAALGPDAVVARSVNSQSGMWVGFSIDRDRYWMQADAAPASPLSRGTWFAWIGIAVLATLVGSIAIASLINRPLRQLSFAASRIREGDLDSRLDENTLTSEIREVNRGFNRMARELARVEEDRAVMLAGISHDLRTPLARLRLETEMSVVDEEARRNMASDIDQLDTIIDKFMDYARPGETQMRPVLLAPVIKSEAVRFRDPTQIRITAAGRVERPGELHEAARLSADQRATVRVQGGEAEAHRAAEVADVAHLEEELERPRRQAFTAGEAAERLHRAPLLGREAGRGRGMARWTRRAHRNGSTAGFYRRRTLGGCPPALSLPALQHLEVVGPGQRGRVRGAHQVHAAAHLPQRLVVVL